MTTRWRAALLLLVATSVLSCGGGAMFRGAPPGQAAARGGGGDARVSAPALEADALQLEPLLTVPTGSDAPEPAFSADGHWLAFHGAEGGEHGAGGGVHGQSHTSQLHVLDLRTLEDRVVYEVTHTETVTPYDPYGYGAGGYQYEVGYPAVAVPVPELGYAPAFLGERVLTGTAQPGAIYEGVMTHQLVSLDGERMVAFGPHGTWPQVSADARRVLLQTVEGLVEVDAQGESLASYPGFYAVWSPHGHHFLGHLTPWALGAGAPAWVGGVWPEDVLPPSDNRGGLYLGRDGRIELLVEQGGAPAWHPDGTRFVYERAHVDAAVRPRSGGLALYEGALGTDADGAPSAAGFRERELVASGRSPVVHPGGRFVVYEDPAQGLSVVALGSFDEPPGTPRPLGIAGERPHFSPDGRLLVVSVPRLERRREVGRELVVYRLSAAAPP